MSNLDSVSKQRLESCDPRLQNLVLRLAEKWPVRVIEGHRTVARQKELYDAGKTKLDGVQRKSKHNHDPSLAVDMAFMPIDWSATEKWYRFGSYVNGLAHGMGIDLVWGGDWDDDNDIKDQAFNDLVHFELRHADGV